MEHDPCLKLTDNPELSMKLTVRSLSSLLQAYAGLCLFVHSRSHGLADACSQTIVNFLSGSWTPSPTTIASQLAKRREELCSSSLLRSIANFRKGSLQISGTSGTNLMARKSVLSSTGLTILASADGRIKLRDVGYGTPCFPLHLQPFSKFKWLTPFLLPRC